VQSSVPTLVKLSLNIVILKVTPLPLIENASMTILGACGVAVQVLTFVRNISLQDMQTMLGFFYKN
jgi:hypothetical protein